MRVGRTLYSETNFDISRMSFFTQEIMALVVCLLIIIVWFQWIEFYKSRNTELEGDGEHGALCRSTHR